MWRNLSEEEKASYKQQTGSASAAGLDGDDANAAADCDVDETTGRLVFENDQQADPPGRSEEMDSAIGMAADVLPETDVVGDV